ncbi:TPA: hypothetical protein P0E22_005179 [Vibrio harveyi]|nr:hypothetical protein [Vibrio harveyi]
MSLILRTLYFLPGTITVLLFLQQALKGEALFPLLLLAIPSFFIANIVVYFFLLQVFAVVSWAYVELTRHKRVGGLIYVSIFILAPLFWMLKVTFLHWFKS